jgi:hypothetical protein
MRALTSVSAVIVFCAAAASNAFAGTCRTRRSRISSSRPINFAHLKTLKGVEFDRAYIANEVTYHQSVLQAVDRTLIPNAKNAELKALIVEVRPAFVAHIEHAKKVQASQPNDSLVLMLMASSFPNRIGRISRAGLR